MMEISWTRLRHRLVGVALALGWLVSLPAEVAIGQSPEASPEPSASPGSQVTWAAEPADTEHGTGRTHYTYLAEPGDAISDALAIVNRSATSISLSVYANDAFTTPSGGIDLQPADELPTDVGAWVSLATNIVTLAPQEEVVIPFTITVPEDATPGDHAGGIVTSLVTEGQVQVDYRLGSRLYVRVGGELRPELTITDVTATHEGTLNPIGTGTVRLDYTVTNTGNVRLGSRQQVEVRGPLGLLGRTQGFDDLPELLPRDSFTPSLTVNGIWPAFLMTAEIQLQPVVPEDVPALGGAPPASGSATFWAWPIGQGASVLALAAAALGYRWRVVRRRRAIQGAIDRAVTEAVAKERASQRRSR